jgi:hypothetical protein
LLLDVAASLVPPRDGRLATFGRAGNRDIGRDHAFGRELPTEPERLLELYPVLRYDLSNSG